jgi:uroporphyrin-III C-methyltransferase
MKSKGMVYIVGAGPGNPDLITVKGRRCIRRAAVILHDRLIHPDLLAQAHRKATIVDVGKRAGNEEEQQAEIHRLMIEHAREGKMVCRLQGGDPSVFGRSGEEIAALAAANIRFEIVPGVSSITAAPASAGIPLTHRDFTHGFLVIAGARTIDFNSAEWRSAQKLLQEGGTVVVLMSLTRLQSITANLLENGCSPEIAAAAISRATTDDQEVRRGVLGNIAERAAGLRTPALLIVGKVVALGTNP